MTQKYVSAVDEGVYSSVEKGNNCRFINFCTCRQKCFELLFDFSLFLFSNYQIRICLQITQRDVCLIFSFNFSFHFICFWMVSCLSSSGCYSDSKTFDCLVQPRTLWADSFEDFFFPLYGFVGHFSYSRSGPDSRENVCMGMHHTVCLQEFIINILCGTFMISALVAYCSWKRATFLDRGTPRKLKHGTLLGIDLYCHLPFPAFQPCTQVKIEQRAVQSEVFVLMLKLTKIDFLEEMTLCVTWLYESVWSFLRKI